jgi:hypothetical protein
MNQQAPSISLTNTKGIKNSGDTSIFQQGFILRSVSKFVTGTDNDQIMPIPIFFDPLTNKILEDSLPPELREELKDELL